MKYIDAEKLKAEIERRLAAYQKNFDNADNKIARLSTDGRISSLKALLPFINSLQQEPTPDTDVLHTKLVNLLKTYRIGEETAITLADRIADTYGAQRYMDGLCDGLKQEQPNIDLEEEVKKYFEGYWPGMKTPEACNHQMVLTPPAIMRMIEHFYELGKNSK
jgi:hypothetical protein